MSESPYCPPTVVPGWGGAGDACASAVSAAGVVAEIERLLQACFPQHWQSVAADGFTERLTQLLVGCRSLGDLVAQLEDAARQLAEEVADVHPAAS